MSSVSGISKKLGEGKSRVLSEGYYILLDVIEAGQRNRLISGIVAEGAAKEFIAEFLPDKVKLKNGLIFDPVTKTVSPQIDAIIYEGVPLLQYPDVAIVEKDQVKAVFEIKSWIAKNDIFGQKKKGNTRNAATGLYDCYIQRKKFLPPSSPYILFTFDVSCKEKDHILVKRLKQISDMHAIVARENGRETVYDFDDSISRLIDWLRRL